MKKNFISAICVFIFFSVILNERVYALPYYLIDLESPYSLNSGTLETVILGGQEKGYIPDWYVQPRMSYGIFNWFMIGGWGSYVNFKDQKERRITEYEVNAKLRFVEFDTLDMGFYGYFKFRHSPGDLVYIDYQGDIEKVVAMVSPHADGGMDYTGGLCGRLSFPFYGNKMIIMYSADYSFTASRKYYPDNEEYTRRMFFSFTPALAFSGIRNKIIKKDSLALGLQNRYIYWYSRGYKYDLMPQLCWGITKSTAVMAGTSIPVYGGGKDYRFLGEISMKFDVGYQMGSLRVDLDVSPDHFSPDGDEIDDFLYIYPVVETRNRIKRWSIVIEDPDGNVFKKYSGTGTPQKVIKWNGLSDRDRKVSAMKEYKIIFSVTDMKNNSGGDSASVSVDRLIK